MMANLKRGPIKSIVNNFLLIAVPAFFIRFIIWIITLKIDTGVDVTWKASSLLQWKKLLFPEIFIQDGLLLCLFITVSITLSAWFICILLSILLSYFSYAYNFLRIPVNFILSISNLHLFFGFLFLFFLWGGQIKPDWFWATIIVIGLNGSLSGMTKKFISQINETLSHQYVLFAISQGINKWRSARNELSIKFIYNALELLPFFLLSTIIVELVFVRLKGLGSLLLFNINDIINNRYDRVDEIFIIVILLITIIRIAKILSLRIEYIMNAKLNTK